MCYSFEFMSAALLTPGRGVTLPTSGAAFYMDPLVNINGSLNHSPGARAAAAMAALPYDGYGAQTWWAGGGYDNTDVILFGGLTAVNKSESFPSGEACVNAPISIACMSPVRN